MCAFVIILLLATSGCTQTDDYSKDTAPASPDPCEAGFVQCNYSCYNSSLGIFSSYFCEGDCKEEYDRCVQENVSISIMQASYDRHTENLTLMLRNTGTAAAVGLEIYLLYTKEEHEEYAPWGEHYWGEYLNETINPNTTKTFEITPWNDCFDSVAVGQVPKFYKTETKIFDTMQSELIEGLSCTDWRRDIKDAF